MILNAFSVLTASQNGNGLWRHPEDERHRFNDLDWWVAYARRIEDAGFTALMFADSFGTGDVSDALDRAQLEEGAYFPATDPFVYVPALAGATSRLSFIATASTTFENPYALARRIGSLDHLARGRFGWNIVTSFVPAMGRAYGTPLPPHTERYARADEFLRACYVLWEGSWEDGAATPGSDRLVDPDRVHDVSHEGDFFRLSGRFTVSPSPQRTPVLVQAGHSSQGTDFAARHAEVVLVTGTKEEARTYIAEVRRLAAEHGRDPSALRFLIPAVVVTGADDADAARRVAEYRRLWSRRASAAVMALFTGYDLTAEADDGTFSYAQTDRHQSAARTLASAGDDGRSRKEAYERATAFPGSHIFISGGPETVADELEAWTAIGVDGVNLMDLVSPADMHRFIEHVVPELDRRGLVERPQGARTLREHLFGRPRLSPDHPGAGLRPARHGADA
ncbi:NtaA/DmoA family FMN-dependent monooxygenase [Microbacterium sp. 18062]|uniref:NtaA/DmoA family FMN-dependent monooxygenase n=1 Tax=Microbacterium sp. 18062 TaxID=2681410 RepID=UPI00135770D4|nr:NtaA/DmoA family FMN-dependent monooxygenase [Microbacterium sp. 18062]